MNLPKLISSTDSIPCSDNHEVLPIQNPENSDPYHGLFYSQRLNSFINAGWPTARPGSINTPHELAMAGLKFHKKGEAKCVVCHNIITGLTSHSDPWEEHKQKNYKCPIIKLGKPDCPDGWKVGDFYNLVVESQAQYLEKSIKLDEKSARNKVRLLVQEELDAQKQQKK